MKRSFGAALGVLLSALVASQSAQAASLFDLKGSPDVGSMGGGSYDIGTKHLVVEGISMSVDGLGLDVDLGGAWGNYSLDVTLTGLGSGSILVDGDRGLGTETFFSSNNVLAYEITSTQVAVLFGNNAGTIQTGKSFLTIVNFTIEEASWNAALTSLAGVTTDTAPVVPSPASAGAGLVMLGGLAAAKGYRRRRLG